MKVFLLYSDRDVAVTKEPAANVPDLVQDLELETLFQAMATGDEFLLGVIGKIVLAGLCDTETILYRQAVLRDCLNQPVVIREIYSIAVEAIEREHRVWGGLLDRYPESALHRSIEVLQIFFELLKKLRKFVDGQRKGFRSEGFRRLFEMLAQELNDDYLGIIESYLHQLGSRNGILMSAQLGKGNIGSDYILHKPLETKQSWLGHIRNWLEQLAGGNGGALVYEVADRDEAGLNALSELRGRGIGNVAAALGQSTQHILDFFRLLRFELAFYIACLNLCEQLNRRGGVITFPEPLPMELPMLTCTGLYDACLSLRIESTVIGNSVTADGNTLVMITGANQGGKSTFLRSVGLAQLMLQCGMFVAAEKFSASLCAGIFTHFKREEDVTMKSGKLDEELSRMSTIVDTISPYGLVLLNESFASTNEREGSEIARQIVRALLEMKIRVVYVTHMFDLAHSFYQANMEAALFLRAERLDDGTRTFRVIEGEPLRTSFGSDLYERIFGVEQSFLHHRQ